LDKNTFIFRIIHYKNLNYILKNGIFCCNSPHQSSNYIPIGDKALISSRGLKEVPISPFGVLNDYIPFYFGFHSPMLYKIYKGTVDNIKCSQSTVIYLISSVEEIITNKLEFVFTDRHAYQQYANFFNDINGLNKLDWNVIKAKNWANNIQDNDRMSRKQAEFLVYNFLPVNCIINIGVYNKTTLKIVETVIKQNNLNIPVSFKPDWYY